MILDYWLGESGLCGIDVLQCSKPTNPHLRGMGECKNVVFASHIGNFPQKIRALRQVRLFLNQGKPPIVEKK
jgi:hypothetical protein